MKINKMISRVIIVWLAVIMLYGCAENSDTEFIAPTTENTEGETTETTAEPPIERPYIPDGVNYGGYTFRVLRPETYIDGKNNDEVFAEQETGEPLNDAIYRRNAIVESLINIKIQSVTANVGTGELAGYARRIIQSGSDDFDAVIGANWTPISLLQDGCLVNLYNIPNLNLSKPWWDQRAIEELSFRRSKLYYISGDINYYDKYGIMVLYFNKRLFDENGFGYPYDKVRNGAWNSNR